MTSRRAKVYAPLALGIGGTTAIFSVVRPVLLEPLPYPDGGRIAMLQEVADDGTAIDGTFGMFRELSERASSFEAIAVVKPWQPTLTGPDRPERLEGQRVSGGRRARPARPGGTAALACAVPAWRAARVDPATTLRAE